MLYRITPEERDAIEQYQRKDPRLCYLLGKKRNCIDHDHTTGELRGYLDWRINKGLGLLEKVCKTPEDMINVLQGLLDYFMFFPAEATLGGKRYGLIGLAKANKKKKVYGPPK